MQSPSLEQAPLPPLLPSKTFALRAVDPRQKPPPVKPELQQSRGAALHLCIPFPLQRTGAGRCHEITLHLRMVQAQGSWEQDEGQLNSLHSALS